MSDKTAVGILKEGRKKIEKGWTRGKFKKGIIRPKYCAVGALRGSGYYGTSEYATAYNALFSAVVSKLPLNTYWTTSGVVVQYNDEIAKDKSEIIDLYDVAISSLEHK